MCENSLLRSRFTIVQCMVQPPDQAMTADIHRSMYTFVAATLVDNSSLLMILFHPPHILPLSLRPGILRVLPQLLDLVDGVDLGFHIHLLIGLVDIVLLQSLGALDLVRFE